MEKILSIDELRSLRDKGHKGIWQGNYYYSIYPDAVIISANNHYLLIKL